MSPTRGRPHEIPCSRSDYSGRTREHRNNQSYQKLIDILEEQDKYEESNSYREKLKAFEKLGISDING